MSEAFLSPSWHRAGPLRLRLRPNLTIRRQRVQGRAWYVVHDVTTGKSHRCTPAAYSVICAMDGRRTVDDIWQEAAERLGDEAPSQVDIVGLLAQLHQADLLQANVGSDASELFSRYSKQRRRDLIGRFMNPMSIRVALIDPDKFLEATAFLVRPLISRFGVLLWLAVVSVAAFLLAPHSQELTANLADRVLSKDGLLLLAIVFPLLKVFHELGHAYAVKAGGGEVHELGVMFIALFPVPYVEASASTVFRSKWRRAGVAAAGMLTETFIAAIAAFVWLMVEPGLTRAIAFNVMLVAGVSTLVFNGNPLLKLDAYYILSDLIEVPNLAQRATRFYGWLCESKLFGAEVKRPQGSPAEVAWFLFYAPAAFVYRMIVMVGMSLFLAAQWFFIGVFVAIVGVVMGLVVPFCKMIWHVLTSPRLHRVRTRAVGLTAGAACVIAAFVVLVPLPLRTTTEGVVWLNDDAAIRMAVNGLLLDVAVANGTRVAPGDVLVRCDDPALRSEAEVLRAQIESLRARYDSEQYTDRVQAEVTRKDVELKSENLARAEDKLAALIVRARSGGTVEVPRASHLAGRWLRRGDIVGYVLPDSATNVRVVVPQADIDLVRRRVERTDILLPDNVWRPIRVQIAREVPAASDRIPSQALAIDNGGRVAVSVRDPKSPRALDRWFQLDLDLPPAQLHSHFGSRVYVRFDHGSEPLGDQLWRRGRQLVLSRLTS